MLSEEEIIRFCLTFDGACVRYPYGPTPLVLSTSDTHEFCELYEGTKPLHMVMKCDSANAVLLREKYPVSIVPGYRCNKKYWNSVYVDGKVPDSEIKDMLKQAFETASKMTKKKKKAAEQTQLPSVVPNTPKEFEF